MKNLFIPYEQALELKELGFDFNQLNYRDGFHTVLIENPLYSQVFKWFREKHNLWNMIYPRYDWNFNIQYIKDFDTIEDKGWGTDKESFHGSKFRTYEEAEFECLKKLIEIVKK